MLKSDPVLFWTMFGAIGTTAAAIATFLSLHQARQARKKKAKTSFLEEYIIQDVVGKKTEVTGVNFANIGDKGIIIEIWGFVFGGSARRKKANIINQATVADMSDNVQLPCAVETEHSQLFLLRREVFISLLKSAMTQKSLKWSRVTFFLLDSTGKIYECTSKKRVKDFLQEKE